MYFGGSTFAGAPFGDPGGVSVFVSLTGKGLEISTVPDNLVTFLANGDAQLSTATKKFGTASLLLDGTGDSVTSTNSNVIDGNFTVEFFAYASSFAQDAILWDQRVSNSGFAIGTNTSSQVIIYADGSAVATGFSGFNNNAFNHIALVRNSGVLTIYVNGVARGTAQTYNTNYTGQPYNIGSSHTDTNYFTGNIDEFRTSSIARYTSAFTPPSSEFSVDNDTFSLLHFDGANGSTDIVNSVTGEGITIIGNARVLPDGTGTEITIGNITVRVNKRVDVTGNQINLATGTASVISWNPIVPGATGTWVPIDPDNP